jgi:hypothetical protein
MVSKISRYRQVPDVTALDAQGRVLATKDLRLLPQVSGTFHHSVQAGDRLDHLSYKYYGHSLKWWRICDANPDCLSPLALLGQEAIATASFPVITGAGAPPWAALFHTLGAVLGVEGVQVLEDVELVPQEQMIGGTTVTVTVERYTWEVRVTYNRLNVTMETLANLIETAGLSVGEPVQIGQLGQEIVIPPAAMG